MESTNDRPSNQNEEIGKEKEYVDVPSLEEKRDDEVKSQSNSESPEEAPANPADAELENTDRIRRLILVVTLTLACFLVTLDASIIATVGQVSVGIDASD